MKFLRFGPMGLEKPGILGRSGQVRDVSDHILDITPETIASGRLEHIRTTIDPEALPLAPTGVRIGSCLISTGNFIAIELNYAEQATETDAASRYVILNPGDVITTGTPHGVGLGLNPPRYLSAGDTMRLSVEGLGEQLQKVVAWPGHLAPL